jgi:hypothetical protein
VLNMVLDMPPLVLLQSSPLLVKLPLPSVPARAAAAPTAAAVLLGWE